jgi:thioredoxin-related protein
MNHRDGIGVYRTRYRVRSWLTSALLAAGLLAVSAVPADPPENYPFLAYDQGLAQARRDSRRIFLYFGRYGCGWCDKTNREAFSDPAVREQYTRHYVLVYVDAESGRRLTLPSGERITEMELGARFKAFATPLFAWLEPDGRLILKVSGIQSAQDFHDYDRFVHSEVYRSKDFKQFLAEPR